MGFDLENPLSTSHKLNYHSGSIPSAFDVETHHMPSHDYFQSLAAGDICISVRREAISLILHFSCNFDPFLSYLAINYLDRFLSTQRITQGKPWVVRLLAISCLYLALKMRETGLSVTDIQENGAGVIFDAQTIRRMELLILGALRWRMRSITPFYFINFFISLFKFKDPPSIQALKARATEIIFKAKNDIKPLEFRPSLIAASALLFASHELFPLQFRCFRNAISKCSNVNKEKLFGCYDLMQEIAMEGYESVLEGLSSASTPVNVLDLHFPSSDSEKTNRSGAIIKVTTVRLEKDMKRRKISSCFKNDNSVLISKIQNC